MVNKIRAMFAWMEGFLESSMRELSWVMETVYVLFVVVVKRVFIFQYTYSNSTLNLRFFHLKSFLESYSLKRCKN